jgi:hypothetical protein
LYPDGPTDGALWERAGGDNADLAKASTGRLRWGTALQAIISGQRGAPSLGTLVDTMRSDYPHNADLKLLSTNLMRKES